MFSNKATLQYTTYFFTVRIFFNHCILKEIKKNKENNTILGVGIIYLLAYTYKEQKMWGFVTAETKYIKRKKQ